MSRVEPLSLAQAQPVTAAAPLAAAVPLAAPRRWLARLRPGPLALAALALAGCAILLWPGPTALAAAVASAALVTTLGAVFAMSARSRPVAGSARAHLAELLATDPDRLVVTGLAGTGAAADLRAVEDELSGWCAEPARAAMALLLARPAGGAVTRQFRRGTAALRVAVHPVGPGDGQGALLWRFTRIDRPGARALDALGLPMASFGADGALLGANPALLRLFDAQGPSDPALQPLLDQAVPALMRDERALSLRLPGGQTGGGLVVPARDGPRDLLVLPAPFAGSQPPASPPHDHEDIPVALVQIDAEGRIWGTNRAARNLLGLGPAEDRFLWEVVEGLGRPVADWVQDARAGRALNRPEVLRATCAGPETFVQIILRRAAPGAPPGALVAVVSDATELKSLEARFVQSQKMQAIGQLAGGIAHDFNNLLTAINGHCDLLLMGRDTFDPDFGDLQQIQQNANRAAALVRQLLAFSRKQTLQPEVLRVEGLLEDVVLLLTRLVGERIALRLRHDPAVGSIRADRRQLEQVIVNLVVNARDAMPMGGEIRIETQAVMLDADRAMGRTSLPAGPYAVIRVVDTGIGIPADLLDKIFEPFFTTKRPGEGTGLGLSTAYGIVKQMGGFIFVDSREGSGTTFSLYFGAEAGASDEAPLPPDDPLPPAAAVRAVAAPANPSPPAAPPRSRRQPLSQRLARGGAAAPARPALPPPEHAGIILLAEDEAPVRAFAARALRIQGYQVLEVEDGEQALELLADRGLAVDLFVSDVIMPGLDGPTWVARALELRPETPVVFISGYIEDTLTEALGRTRNAVFLEKPFSLDTLCRTIAGQMELAPARADRHRD